MIQLITHQKGYNPIQAKVTLNQGNCYITKLFLRHILLDFINIPIPLPIVLIDLYVYI